MATKQGFLRIGDTVPDFQAHVAIGDQIQEIKFHEWLNNSWGVLFSHPADFTPVCTTELGEVGRLRPSFEERGVKVIALSCDSAESHTKWHKDIEEYISGKANTQVSVNYPIIADPDRTIASLYGMLDQTNVVSGLPLTVRSVFVIDPKKTVRLILTYPASCGRNFDEILRVIDSMQTTDKSKVVTPANWRKGDDVIIAPSVSNESASQNFGNFTTLKPYLRIVKASQIKS